MATQTLIIGLGQFGRSLAVALARNGCEVLAVDVHEENVRAIAPYVTEAVCMDAMDEEALATLAPARRDVSVCAIGNENREGSMIVTALLRQLGAPRVIARATDELHARVLNLIGANEVVMPESYFGERLAIRLIWQGMVDVLPIGGDLVLTEVKTPDSFVGQTLGQLAPQTRFSVLVAAVRRPSQAGESTTLPDLHTPLQAGDVLIVVGTADDTRRMVEG